MPPGQFVRAAFLCAKLPRFLGQKKKRGRNRPPSPTFPCFSGAAVPDITQPPIRSNNEWGVHFWIGFSNTSYLLLSLDYRSDARGNIWGIENSGYLPIHKTSGTRRRLLWFLPKYSRVAHPSEKCFVFGNLPELRLL